MPEDAPTTLTDRQTRALTEYLTVVPEAPGMYSVTSGSGKTYTVDARDGACTCDDSQYRDRTCKHLHRVRFETGETPLPEWVDPSELPRDFGAHVDGPDVRARVTAVATGEEVLE